MVQTDSSKLDTDLQTRNDLNVSHSLYGEDNLASLFSNTCSVGGKEILREWACNPISDINILSNRVNAIRIGGLPNLSVDGDSLDFIEYYLNYDEPVPQVMSGLITYYGWLKDKFNKRPWVYVKEQGCYLLCELFYNLGKSVEICNDDDPVMVRQMAQSIHWYLESNVFDSLPFYGNLKGGFEIDKLDYIFRNKGKLAVRGLLDIVYLQDALLTAHSVAEKNGFCYPEFVSDNTVLDVKGFFHPQLPNAVKNDWNMNDRHICIFTGSNMAGKSTTLKALSSIIWLSHAGLPVPAESMKTSVYSGIFTSINLPDSLKKGESHFYAEVMRVKLLLQKVKEGKPYFIVFDELFRGTNARDAYDASEIVLNILKNCIDSKFLISTHILELAEAFQKEKTCCFRFMESNIEDNRFCCTYKLKEGISESRIGSWLVRKELVLN